MIKEIRIVTGAVALAAMLVAGPAAAERKAGDIIGRIGLTNVDPDSDNGDLNKVAPGAPIDVDDDTAVGKWRAFLTGTFVEEGRSVSRLILIDCLDDYVRIDGKWFIKKLDILFNFNVEFGSSWAGSARQSRCCWRFSRADASCTEWTLPMQAKRPAFWPTST